jgi:precorrin-8X/cobalt-precorrin-8 methylmutase
MPLFDAYVMVDWSGGDRRCAGRQDCIWIAFGLRIAKAPMTVSPPSRTEAEHVIRTQLQDLVTSKKQRVLVCADFGYGYPTGFASLLRKSVGEKAAPWRIVWRYLKEQIRDDIGTMPGARPSNRSNRFEVASRINAGASTVTPGPFWCLYKAGSYDCVPQKRPLPAGSGNRVIPSLRITDQRARSDTPFRLFGTGSVGSQVLTGIPRLANLRFHPEFAGCSAVWPFETGWAPMNGSWLARSVKIVHAEIYPSLRAPMNDTIKDRGQVRTMWHSACDLDKKNSLLNEFAIPSSIVAGSYEDNVIREEEGWILGSR